MVQGVEITFWCYVEWGEDILSFSLLIQADNFIQYYVAVLPRMEEAMEVEEKRTEGMAHFTSIAINILQLEHHTQI